MYYPTQKLRASCMPGLRRQVPCVPEPLAFLLSEGESGCGKRVECFNVVRLRSKARTTVDSQRNFRDRITFAPF